MSKKYKPGLISTKRSYTLNQICQIYSEDKLHKQTIRKWIKKEGLCCFGPQNKRLIQGSDLKTFLECKNNPKTPPMQFECFKCLKCKERSIPTSQTISITRRPNGTLGARGTCSLCGGQINKIFKGGDREKLHEFFTVEQNVVETRSDCSDTSSKAHMKKTEENSSCEPDKDHELNSEHLSSKTHLGEQQMKLF